MGYLSVSERWLIVMILRVFSSLLVVKRKKKKKKNKIVGDDDVVVMGHRLEWFLVGYLLV